MLSSSNTITKVTARKLLLRKNWKLSLSSHPSSSLSARSHNNNNNNNNFSTSAPRPNNAHPHSTTDNDATATSKPGTNSNPSEVDKFSSFAGHWWDSRANPLVGMNPIRIRFMREVLLARQPQQPQQPHPEHDPTTPISPSSLPPLHGKRVLDIGCGGGLLTESMARLGASTVVGVDASSRVVEVAKRRRHSFSRGRGLGSCDDGSDGDDADKVENGIRYFGGMTVEELADDWHSHRRRRLSEDPSSNSNNNNEYELFDVITALEIIEHVPDPTSLLRSAVSLLRPDGILFVSTINRTWKSYGMAIVAAEYISGKVPIGTHDWNRFWSPDEVERMVCRVERDGSDSDSGRVIDGGCEETRYAMKQVGLSGMVVQPPFVNLKWSLDPLDTDVNWIGAYQKQRVR